MLRVEHLSAAYGEAAVLRDVSLDVAAGEVVTLCGRNGAGKTTLLRCVMGLHKPSGGRIEFLGQDLAGRPAHRRARLGLGWVPDDRGGYATLSVAESLTLPPAVDPRSVPQRRGSGGETGGFRHRFPEVAAQTESARWSLERVYEAFPALAARRHAATTTLSGGELQMLALARVLRMGARLLLCDEPTEGLAPLLVSQVGDILREAKANGVTVLLVEQNLHFATTVADRHYLLAEGRIVEALDNSEVHAREPELLAYLGI